MEQRVNAWVSVIACTVGYLLAWEWFGWRLAVVLGVFGMGLIAQARLRR